MSDYILRGIDKDLWLKVKHYAIDHKMTYKAILLEALVEYLKKRGK